MKPSSAKQKGRTHQQYVRDKILDKYPQLEKDDVRSTGMGQGGEDVQLSPRARELFNFSVECKSKAAFAGYAFYDQAAANRGESIPIVVVKANRRKPLVLIDFDDFLGLLP
jgi:hypothetical protein